MLARSIIKNIIAPNRTFVTVEMHDSCTADLELSFLVLYERRLTHIISSSDCFLNLLSTFYNSAGYI